MFEIIQELFTKRGIKDLSELSEQEKQDYDRWVRILSDGEISVDSIKKFCQNQISLIETKWKDLDNLNQKNERLIVQHNVYKSILTAIESPRQEREQLEKYLRNLI